MQQVAVVPKRAGFKIGQVARNLFHIFLHRMTRDAGQRNSPCFQFDRQVRTSAVKKSIPAVTAMCEAMKSFHAVV